MQHIIKVALFAFALSSCDTSRLTGESGEVVFEYYTDLNPLDFNKPIARGAELHLRTTNVGEDREPLELVGATAIDEQVLRTGTPDNGGVTVYADDVGATHLSVSGITASGAEVSDRVRVRVAEIARVRLGSSFVADAIAQLPSSLRPAALTDEEREIVFEFEPEELATISWTRFAENGEALIGRDVFPLQLDPPNAARWVEDNTTDTKFALQMPDDEVVFRVRPAPGVAGNTIRIEVVEPDVWDDATSFASAAWRTLTGFLNDI